MWKLTVPHGDETWQTGLRKTYGLIARMAGIQVRQQQFYATPNTIFKYHFSKGTWRMNLFTAFQWGGSLPWLLLILPLVGGTSTVLPKYSVHISTTSLVNLDHLVPQDSGPHLERLRPIHHSLQWVAKDPTHSKCSVSDLISRRKKQLGGRAWRRVN